MAFIICRRELFNILIDLFSALFFCMLETIGLLLDKFLTWTMCQDSFYHNLTEEELARVNEYNFDHPGENIYITEIQNIKKTMICWICMLNNWQKLIHYLFHLYLIVYKWFFMHCLGNEGTIWNYLSYSEFVSIWYHAHVQNFEVFDMFWEHSSIINQQTEKACLHQLVFRKCDCFMRVLFGSTLCLLQILLMQYFSFL